MAEAWQSEPCGSLPDDPGTLWRLAGAKSRRRFESCAEAVLQSFDLEDGRYWNRQLVSLYDDMEAIGAERRIAGRLGASAKWGRGKRMANAMTLPKQTDGDIEEMRKEREVDSEKQLHGKAEREPETSSFARIAGLTKAVFEEKAMPRAAMDETELQARRKKLREQADRLKESPLQ
jgi:hypothetical protein